jgi:hypothetical protein
MLINYLFIKYLNNSMGKAAEDFLSPLQLIASRKMVLTSASRPFGTKILDLLF